MNSCVPESRSWPLRVCRMAGQAPGLRLFFPRMHFKHKLGNGEHLPREWLYYSPLEGSVFSFACKVFGRDNEKSPFGSVSYSNLKHASEHIADHKHGADKSVWSFLKAHIDKYGKTRGWTLYNEYDEVISRVKRAKYSSVSVDSIPEIRHMDHMSHQRALYRSVLLNSCPLQATQDRCYLMQLLLQRWALTLITVEDTV